MTSPGRHRSAPSLTCPWSLIVALITLVGILSLLAHGSGTLSVDTLTTDWVQSLDRPVFSALADLGNGIGNFRIALPLWAMAAVAATALKRRRELVFLIVLLSLRGAATILKGVFASPRPTSEVAELVGTHEGLGFPSGHAVTASVAVGGIVFLALRHAPSRSVRLALVLTWCVCVALTAYARIWVGAHWLTDTIGGTLVGAAIVLVSANVSALVDAINRPSRSEGR